MATTYFYHFGEWHITDKDQSVIRKKIAPNAPDPTPADKSCFRWLLPAGELRDLSITADIVRRGALMEWAAAGKARLVMYPCSNNEVLNLVAFLPTAHVGKVGEGRYIRPVN